MQPAGPVPVLTLPWELGSTGSWNGQICSADSPRALAFSAALPFEMCLQSPWMFLVTLGK